MNIEKVRENITPRGDGNLLIAEQLFNDIIVGKREYNSERRRKLKDSISIKVIVMVRENITPRGDGNNITLPFPSTL